MPEPIRLEPWHRLSRAVPTYETVAHQAIGPEWEDLARTVQIAPVKGPLKQWGVALFDGIRRIRDWTLPGPLNASDAQKAAERLVQMWGIRDEDINTEAGQEKPMSLEQPNGFEWKRLLKTVVAMFQDRQTRADGVMVINRLYPGRGTELGEAMTLIEKAAQKDFMALMDIKAITDAVKGGSLILVPELEKLRMVNEARKAARGLTPSEFQSEVTRLATQPSEVIEQSPYSMLTQ